MGARKRGPLAEVGHDSASLAELKNGRYGAQYKILRGMTVSESVLALTKYIKVK